VSEPDTSKVKLRHRTDTFEYSSKADTEVGYLSQVGRRCPALRVNNPEGVSMYDQHRVLALLDRSEPGKTLPQAFYTDEAIFRFDVSAVFARSWILVGFEAELSLP
jgi:hypothetical protein